MKPKALKNKAFKPAVMPNPRMKQLEAMKRVRPQKAGPAVMPRSYTPSRRGYSTFA